MHNGAAAGEIDLRNVGSQALRVAFRCDEEDRRLAFRAAGDTPKRLDQHGAVAGEIVELLGIVLTRQRPQARPDTTAHHKADDRV